MNNKLNLFDLRVLRAVDEPELAGKFYRGHQNELAAKGLAGISFTGNDWFANPHVYLMAIVSGETIIGGSRIHLYHPDHPYPFEEALRKNKPEGLSALNQNSNLKQAEWCGLWLSNKFRGLGIAESMNRVAIATCHSFGLELIYGICPRHTMDLFRSAGFRFMTQNDELIKFHYPTPKYVSYIIQCEVKNMEFTFKSEKNQIMAILNDPESRMVSKGLLGEAILDLKGIPTISPKLLINPGRNSRWSYLPIHSKKRLSEPPKKSDIQRAS